MSESHVTDEDPWRSARESARADVQAALRPRAPRTCPDCGRVETGAARTCPACGGDFVVRRSKRVDRRVVAGVVAAIVLVGGLAAAVIPGWRSRADEAERTRAAAQQRLEASERERLLREQHPVRVDGPARRGGETAL